MLSRPKILAIRERTYFSAIRKRIYFSAIREKIYFSAIRVFGSVTRHQNYVLRFCRNFQPMRVLRMNSSLGLWLVTKTICCFLKRTRKFFFHFQTTPDCFVNKVSNCGKTCKKIWQIWQYLNPQNYKKSSEVKYLLTFELKKSVSSMGYKKILLEIIVQRLFSNKTARKSGQSPEYSDCPLFYIE